MGERWRCDCGETILASFTQCWKCGAVRSQEGTLIPGTTFEVEKAPETPPTLEELAERVRAAESPEEAGPYIAAPRLWIEVGVVLVLTILPSLAGGFWWFNRPLRITNFVRHTSLGLVDDLQLMVPLLYIMARSGTAWRTFGLVKPSLLFDGFLALILFLIDYGFDRLALPLLSALFSASPFHSRQASGTAEHALLVLGMAVSGFAQELAMRGYLVPRLETLLKSTTAGIVLSSVLFASNHLYQGPLGVLRTLLSGLIYASAFAITRRIWPLAIAHAAWNVFCLW
jgi:membrane protease YdiL (CAAX protease family)